MFHNRTKAVKKPGVRSLLGLARKVVKLLAAEGILLQPVKVGKSTRSLYHTKDGKTVQLRMAMLRLMGVSNRYSYPVWDLNLNSVARGVEDVFYCLFEHGKLVCVLRVRVRGKKRRREVVMRHRLRSSQMGEVIYLQKGWA